MPTDIFWALVPNGTREYYPEIFLVLELLVFARGREARQRSKEH